MAEIIQCSECQKEADIYLEHKPYCQKHYEKKVDRILMHKQAGQVTLEVEK